jgi:hypothetical protein
VAVSPSGALDFLEASKIPFLAVNVRYQAKLEVFARLACVVAGATTPAEVQRTWKTLAEAQSLFGGRVVFLAPRSP